MKEPLPPIHARHGLTAAEIDALEDRIYLFNSARTGHADARGIGFVATAADGALVGAVAGYTWGGICELRQVWVDEAWRGRGLGRALLEAAIAEAEKRGCESMFLATFDFQAPGFYSRLRFEEVARIKDKPRGHTDILMKRVLDQPARASQAPEKPAPPHLRVARATNQLEAIAEMYCRGLDLEVLGRFEDHDGFDGILVGSRHAPYHLEFTRQRGQESPRGASADSLLVFYCPDETRWNDTICKMENAGFARVSSENPYWEKHGQTFQDLEGYRVVLSRERWSE